ncbi:lipocalin family protein [Flavobacterium sp. K5-23]|uniref:lipocalin family protein n=1 Tax=Flavobacterium sp. K5-23 TaxID=2746225 RepID=UPI00200DF248|nr:lipocalin family protein [Flavobacterium sp. K5-23]UQD56202.1 lipocalin family protein [Flavobacterium sp. K5-23]
MKKIILIMAMSVLLFSCKTSSITDKKLDKKAQVAVKGNWVLTSVTYPGSEYIKVNSFDIADSKCFVGSTWKFVSNNNKGNMALTKFDCPVFSSPITWFINTNGEFILKVLDAGEKAKRVRAGYILHVANQTDDSFQLVDKGTNVGGKDIDVVYQFQRAN